MMKKLGLGLAVLALAGCATTASEHEHSLFRGVVPVTETDREARSMCSAVSYEEDHDRWLSYTTELRERVLWNRTAPNSPTPAGHADGVDPSRRSPELYGDPNPNGITDALYLISQFEAEIDGSYDAVVQNCRAYNQCMIRNDYTEASCSNSAQAWSNSQDRYHNLALNMAEIRETVAIACDDCGPNVIALPRPDHPRPDHPRGGRGHGEGHGRGHHSDRSGATTQYGPFEAGG
jgi:hypothetical protein